MATNDSNSAHWKPRAYVWDGGFMGIGRSSGVVPPHSHHAFQISLALDGEIRLAGEDGDWTNYQGVAIEADAMHSFDANGARVAMLFVDPESHEGRWLRNTLREPISAISGSRLERCIPQLREFLDDPPGIQGTVELVLSIVQCICSGPPPNRKLDPRMVKAIEFIRASDTASLAIDDVARHVFLSPSRFAHLFSDEIGLPFRRYLLWRKVTRAIVLVGRGQTLSAAAHAAGFSDSAHLTRTFYQMFGIPPTVMMGGGDFYEIPAPFEVPVPTN
jgi:AraC family transcriptional regulator